MSPGYRGCQRAVDDYDAWEIMNRREEEREGEPIMASNGYQRAREALGEPSPFMQLKQGQVTPVFIVKLQWIFFTPMK